MKDNILNEKMSRKDFLKKAGLTLGGAFLALKGMPLEEAAAAPSDIKVSDNLTSGVNIGPTAPGGTKTIWVDTGDEDTTKCYENGEWKPTSAGKAAQLRTARDIKVNLSSEQAATFNGTQNATPGVTGTLPVEHGGTGATTAEDALKKIGACRQSNGIAQYWNGSTWVNCKSVWG